MNVTQQLQLQHAAHTVAALNWSGGLHLLQQRSNAPAQSITIHVNILSITHAFVSHILPIMSFNLLSVMRCERNTTTTPPCGTDCLPKR
jgi:hypothetical protein